MPLSVYKTKRRAAGYQSDGNADMEIRNNNHPIGEGKLFDSFLLFVFYCFVLLVLLTKE